MVHYGTDLCSFIYYSRLRCKVVDMHARAREQYLACLCNMLPHRRLQLHVVKKYGCEMDTGAVVPSVWCITPL